MTDDAPRAGRLAFVKIVVTDLVMMTAFYERAFGFAVHFRFDDAAFEEVLLRQEDHDFLFGLLRRKNIRAAAGPTVGVIGMVTGDIDHAVKLACDHGATLRRAPFDVPGTRVALVDDPEGNEIELVQFV